MSRVINFFRTSGKSHQQQFESLLRPHMPLLYRKACHWTGNTADAEDLLQDVLIKLASKTGEMEKVESLPPWLIRILYRQFVDNYRKQNRSPLVSDCEFPGSRDEDRVTPLDTAVDNNDRLNNLEIRESLSEAMKTLDKDQHKTFFMLEVEGYSIEETASVLGISKGTVKSRNHRAKQKLKKYLAPGTFLIPGTCK